MDFRNNRYDRFKLTRNNPRFSTDSAGKQPQARHFADELDQTIAS